MRTVLVLIAGLMLAMPVLATPPGGCPPGHENIGSCGGDDGNGNGNGGGEGGGTNTNTNTNNNSNTQGQQQGQAQGQAQGQLQGQLQGQIATGGNATATGGSANNDVVIGDTDASSRSSSGVYGSGNSHNTNIAGGGEGGSINIYGGEEGENAPFSNTNDVDASSRNSNTNIVGGGQGGEGGEGGTGLGVGVGIGVGGEGGSVNVGDTTLNNGGNTLIVGGGQGECYEGECEGGSGTLNSNAENTNNIANDNASNAEGGDANVTVNIGEDGPLTASSQSVETASNSSIEEGAVVVEGDEIVYEAAEIPVNSSAPSFSGICNSGAAGTSKGLSLSFAVTNDVCQCLMMADAYMAMGDVEEAHKWVEAAGRHAGWKGGMGYFRHVLTLGIL